MMSAFHAPPPHPAVEYRHQRICRSLALGAGAASFGTGLLALIGWAFAVPALTSIRPAFPSMKPITAICFMLSGGAMWLLRLHAGESRSDRTGQVLAARVIGVVVGLAGILTWFESRLGFSIGIDEVLFRASLRAGGAVNPGRMAAATALGFGFLGASLFLLEGPRPLRYLSQAFSLLAALNGMIGLVAYVYGQSALQQITPYNSMAVHTSILFVCLGIGLLASRPKFGFMAPITSQHIGGLMGRWLLPLVSILPIILGWLRWEGELAGHYNTAVGLVIFTVSTVIMLNLLLWASTFWLNRVDGQRRQALDRDVKLAAIVDSSEDAILSKDLDGTILSWNKGAEKLYGYSAAEVIGRPVYGIIPREYQEDALHFLEEVAQGRPVRREETARRHKDGSLVHVSLLVSPVRNAEGRIIGASSIAHDISERKRAEAALRESEERLRLFIEHAPAALAMFDRDMRYLQVSRRWRTDYGLSDRDLIGICHYEVFPDIPERWKDVHQRGLAGQILHMESDRFQRQDGSEQWLRWEVRPWRRRDGEIGGIVIFAEDITESTLSREQLAAQAQQLADTAAELFKSREALAEQARTLQSVLDNINDGLIAADSRGKFIIWNPAAYRILGKSRQDVPPEQWSEYYRVYLPDKVTPFPYEDLPLAKAIRGVPAYAELFIRYDEQGNGAWVEASATPLRDAQGQVAGGVVAFRDVTQRVIADREIRRMNVELEQRVIERTAQLEAVNKELESFTYSVSHDLRAPLRQISGFVQILVEDFGSSLSADAQRYLSQVSRSSQNMTQLINEMLNLSRLERKNLQRRRVRLNELVAEVTAMLQVEVQARQVEWRIGALPEIECDPVLTRQIFQNLIANALKYSRKRETAVIEIGCCEREGCRAIFVRDNGAGFDMKHAGKLFAAFQRLHRSEDFEGIGIGLATVERIVRKHGGRVWAEGAPDRGATFYFTLGNMQPVERARVKSAAAE